MYIQVQLLTRPTIRKCYNHCGATLISANKTKSQKWHFGSQTSIANYG